MDTAEKEAMKQLEEEDEKRKECSLLQDTVAFSFFSGVPNIGGVGAAEEARGDYDTVVQIGSTRALGPRMLRLKKGEYTATNSLFGKGGDTMDTVGGVSILAAAARASNFGGAGGLTL